MERPPTTDRKSPTENGAGQLSRELLQRAHEVAGIGTYTIDLQRQVIHVSAEMAHLYRAGEEAFALPLAEYRRRFHHPEDRGETADKADAAYRSHAGAVIEARVVRGDGEIIWARSSSSIQLDERGESVVVGVVMDVTGARAAALKEREQVALIEESERRFRALSDNSLVGVYVIESGRLGYVNAAVERMFGYERGELRGVDPLSLFHPDDRPDAAEAMRRRRAGELEGVPLDVRGVRKDGRVLSLVVLGVLSTLDGRPVVIGNILDVTSRRADAHRIERLNRMLRTRSSVNALLIRVPDEQHLFEEVCYEEVCRICVEKTGFLAAWIGVADRATGRVDMAAAAGAHHFLDDLEIRLDGGPLAGGPTATAIREARTVVLEDFDDDGRVGLWHDIGRQRGFGSCAATPIRRGGEVTGALTLCATERGAFDLEIVGLIEEMAADIGFALGTIASRHRERELLAAKEAAEEASRASEVRFRTLIENAPMGIGVSRNGVTLYVNRTTEKMIGYRKEEMVGRPVADFWSLEAREQIERRKHLQDEGLDISTHYEADAVRRDGSRFRAEVDVTPIELPDGPAVVGFMADISERVRAEAARRDNELRFRTFIEKAPLAIGLSREGTGVYANEKFLELWRYESNDAVVGRPVLDHWVPHAREQIADRVRLRSLGLPVPPDDLLAQRSDGTVFPAHLETVSVELPDGPVTAAFITDESERKRAEEAVRAKDAAEQASRAKSSFLAHISHEIRTPMNAILGYAQLLLRDDALGGPQRQQVEVIQSSGNHLLKVLNDVLEMSKIEAGRASLSVAPFDLRGMLDEVEGMFSVLTSAKGIALEVHCDAGLPRALEADGGKIKQVVINLLGNAVKFTERGRIVVRASCTPAATEGPEVDAVRLVRIGVEDSGIGIDAEGLDRLFQTFEQLPAGARIGGTGLGLAISRNLARLMGGDVTAQSTPGAGSVFTFTFEAKLSDVPPAAVDARGVPVRIADHRRPKVLVVDDVATNRDLCNELLSRVGFQTREASNGEEALVVHETWHPDLVLMDLRMAGMNGLDATRRLRESGSKARIVALTASGLSDVEPDALAAGADLFLRKPYDDRDLLQRIGELLGLRYEYQGAIEAPAPSDRRPQALSRLVQGLPADLVRELIEAAATARARRIEELLKDVREHSEAAAAAMGDLVTQFRYDLILEALQGASDG